MDGLEIPELICDMVKVVFNGCSCCGVVYCYYTLSTEIHNIQIVTGANIMSLFVFLFNLYVFNLYV